MDELEKAMKDAARNAEHAGNPSDAMHWSQAALNLAKALEALRPN